MISTSVGARCVRRLQVELAAVTEVGLDRVISMLPMPLSGSQRATPSAMASIKAVA